MKAKDLTGHRSGRLVAIEPNYDHSDGKRRWRCQCDCGNTSFVLPYQLTGQTTLSCGCLQRERSAAALAKISTTHGQSRSSLYRLWSGIRSRCHNPNATGFDRYGGKGIALCQRWHDFEAFAADIPPRPSALHSLDRIDPYGDYEQSNVRWATAEEQANNRRDNHIVIYRGVKMSLRKAARHPLCRVSRHTVVRRLKKGWPVEDAIERPPIR